MEKIDHNKILDTLNKAEHPDRQAVISALKHAEEKKGLSLYDAAVLLNCKDDDFIRRIFELARKVKSDIYGERLVIFAPLYLSNDCSNNCLYCGFRKDNTGFKRKTLTQEELRREVEALQAKGHKRLLLVSGEAVDFDYLKRCINMVYSVKNGKGAIRRVNVNLAPLSLDEYRQLKESGIGTYQLFQETYHLPTYNKMHPSGPKADYNKRLDAIDLAIEGGIDDVGIGVLFGLYDYRFEVLGLLLHIAHLEERFGIGPHTVSVPRLEPAKGADISLNPPYPVRDEDFKKIIAVLRLAVPYTGIILSTRERAELRNELFSLGVSQISVSSNTQPGGYASREKELEQFTLSDKRTMPEAIKDILKMGYLPSFCTACYRLNRTGKDFMNIAKSGEIHKLCLPNCLLTFREYLLDYGSENEKMLGEKIIHKQTESISSLLLRGQVKERLHRLEQGERDLYF